jgi:hypothetical protein
LDEERRPAHNPREGTPVIQLKVPTHAMAAEVRCRDGRLFVGRIFIPDSSSHHSGPMRLEEWINMEFTFFPFLPDDSRSTVLVNKEQVAVLSVAPQADGEVERADLDVPLRRVAVELRDRRIEGDIAIDMPEGHQRVLDYVNRTDRFLLVRGERWYLVQKSAISRVLEVSVP